MTIARSPAPLLALGVAPSGADPSRVGLATRTVTGLCSTGEAPAPPMPRTGDDIATGADAGAVGGSAGRPGSAKVGPGPGIPAQGGGTFGRTSVRP